MVVSYLKLMSHNEVAPTARLIDRFNIQRDVDYYSFKELQQSSETQVFQVIWLSLQKSIATLIRHSSRDTVERLCGATPAPCFPLKVECCFVWDYVATCILSGQ